MNNTIRVKNLEVGQEVAIPNCVATARVAERLGKNLYRLDYLGKQITLPRNQISVRYHGIWKSGPCNSTD